MSASLVTGPYGAHQLSQHPLYNCVTAPQPPPSPPVDETSKCSLPSISSLLGLADGSSPQEQSPQQTSQQQSAQSTKSECRPGSGHQTYGPSPAMSTRGALPPTPPMQSESAFDGRQSPSAGSTSGYSVASAPSYYFTPSTISAIHNVESHPHRQHIPTMPQRRVSMPAASIAYTQPTFNGSQYNMSPTQQPYYAGPMQSAPPQSQISGLYYQRPLPQQFPPSLMPVSVTLTPSSGANPWQHHHYISPSSVASFPQSQDRYICQTCNKAFSRPSSLRIHSHSHTGEKPFKCPHQGCGKAFSVRSNMKRHERGCHSFEGETMA
ncbi:C2H2 and C2HC zinc finger [Venustampulla echinocandica]|uniref:C2H2 and C2HC zinc finger n=1 Tax=Venustampulla echinocandica TaxID=2656787 RepID=A0A370TZX0_9HELO|nr:C2H2 and C2HC zinc finger [Venustampulla echinocandica]RDL41057.1 C2H2 and C2HC zinc finger [Venustampulla echinocandica]